MSHDPTDLILLTVLDPNAATDGFIIGYSVTRVAYHYFFVDSTICMPKILMNFAGEVVINYAVVNAVDLAHLAFLVIFH